MKRFVAVIMAFCLMFSLAYAEPANQPTENSMEAITYDKLTVASTTAMDGNFLLDNWGSNVSDMDVRELLQGYSLVEWKRGLGTYVIDDTVVSGVMVTLADDGSKTYTLALADDLRYSDGTPITARDYAFGLLLTYSPELAAVSGRNSGMGYFTGLSEYSRGEAKSVSGIRILGDYQLSLTIRSDCLPFFYEMALINCLPYPITTIAPGCVIKDDGEGAYIANADETVKEPVFTEALLRSTILDPEKGYLSHPSVVSGPYVLTSFDGETANFSINPFYKGNSAGALPKIQNIIFRHVTNEQAAELMAAGEIGMMSRAVKAETIDSFMQQVVAGNASMGNFARSGYSFISFNCEKPAVGSEFVRRAIALCLDKDTLIENYVGDYGVRVDGAYGIGQWVYRIASGTLSVDVPAPEEGASNEEMSAYEAEQKAWEEMNLDSIKVYEQDIPAAIALLAEDGWTLNSAGETFDAQRDTVRCKRVGDGLISLELTLIYPENNTIGEYLQSTLAEPLKSAGIALSIEAKPFDELINQYYRRSPRNCDMIYMATNFSDIYDPAAGYDPADAQTGTKNNTGIADDEIYKLALSMRETEPGDLLSYCRKWIAFQERFTEIMPQIPIYSNAYFDFYTPMLQNYISGDGVSWANAIIGAYLSDPSEDMTGIENGPGDDESIFADDDDELIFED